MVSRLEDLRPSFAYALPHLLQRDAGGSPFQDVLVIGAGVAGLQAIATAKRLGAVVEAYDVRGATREQVQGSLDGLRIGRLPRRGINYMKQRPGPGLGIDRCT